MSKYKLNKICINCNYEMINVAANRKYCDECNDHLYNKRREKSIIHKKQNRIKEKNKREKEYEKNFFKVTEDNNPVTLTSIGFIEKSKISVKSYSAFYGMTWVDVVRKFGKENLLYNYVVDEYKKFYQNDTSNMQKFVKVHKYITYKLVEALGIDRLMKGAGVTKKSPYTIDEMKQNFLNIKHSLGYVPFYGEFERLTKIPINTYADKFNFKGTVYNEIVKMYSSIEEYENFLYRYKQRKSEQGKDFQRKTVKIVPEDELKKEFIRVFEYCNKEFKQYPPRRLFNKISKFDDSVYRHRYKTSWKQIVEMFGYMITSNNRSEKIVLEIISKIIGCRYEPQKTWSWLIGAGGKNMYCDGFFPEANLVVEFDGAGHRTPIKGFGGEEKFRRIVENDKLKDKLLKENGINLIRIDSRENWHDHEYISNKLIENNIKYNKNREKISV